MNKALIAKLCCCVCGGAVIGGASVHVAEHHHFRPRPAIHSGVKPSRIVSERRDCVPSVSVANSTAKVYNDVSPGPIAASSGGWGFGGFYGAGSFQGWSTSGGSISTSGGHGGSSGGHGGSTTTASSTTSGSATNVPEPETLGLFGLAAVGVVAGRKMQRSETND